MLNLPLDDITINFILGLPKSDLCETEKLDYKRQLDHGMISLHKAVCALSNSVGGDLIIGVSEGKGDRKGYPEEVIGIDHDGLSPDEVSQKYINSCLTGIEPSPRVNAKCFRLKSGMDVVIVRVARSAVAPHRTKTSKFYRRVGTQSVEMDITEIRNSFNFGSNLDVKIDFWRTKRMDAVINLFKQPFVMFNIMPIESLLSRVTVDLSDGYKFPAPTGNYSQFGMDVYGRLAVEDFGEGPDTYMHVSRNGNIEFGFRFKGEKDAPVWWQMHDEWINEGFKHAMKVFIHYEIPTPAIMTGLMNDVSQLKINSSYGYPHTHNYSLDMVDLEPMELDNWSVDSSQFIRPMLDQIWNGFGIEQSGSYDSNGIWNCLV